MENMEFHAVLYGISKAERRKRIESLLNFVELWDRRNDLAKTFSGGMRRRLEIARGLLHHPKILFLDEPTLGLDPQTRNHIWSYAVKLSRDEGMTVFFTTHYMEEAEQNADRIAIIDHGQIVAMGTSEDLRNQTNKATLEEAFIELTGSEIREEQASGMDRMRMRRQAWTKK
jgi:ABC-2 type transport system ATP-binding protein